MCGIVGVIESRGRADAAMVTAMRDRLLHRGPDDAGAWCEENVGLGHRRLSIIDLSAAGHQPMVSADGRFVIVYNGELYNSVALSADLPDVAWRGHSDTEILLEAIASWGIERTLARCNGMYAFAVFDRVRRELVLARDDVGIKPLYYGWLGERFVFASELGAFDVLPAADREVDRDALSSMLGFGNVPAPHSIYRGIRKLLPGTTVRIPAARPEAGTLAEPVAFWSPRATVEKELGPIDDVDEQALALLRRSVASQLVADVPVGAFLSGGIDSSLVVALAQETTLRPLETFTIGFEREEFDESEAARAVAKRLGTEHHELVFSESELLDAIVRIPMLCDEPFGDSSMLPTHLVSRVARTRVTVCLSGDGGDELGWGYTRYPRSIALHERFANVPRWLRSGVGKLMAAPTVLGVARVLNRRGALASRLERFAHVFAMPSHAMLYRQLFMTAWQAPDAVVLGGHQPLSVYDDTMHWTHALPGWRRMPVQDLLAYLPNDILTKVDRASMGVSLETRVPLLDRQFVEFCLRLPPSELFGAGSQKLLLKRLLRRYLPVELIERPKRGFGVPLGEWLRGPLKSWMTDLLSRDRLVAGGYFDPDAILVKLEHHLAGGADWSAWLWNVLMFQTWCDERDRFRRGSSPF